MMTRCGGEVIMVTDLSALCRGHLRAGRVCQDDPVPDRRGGRAGWIRRACHFPTAHRGMARVDRVAPAAPPALNPARIRVVFACCHLISPFGSPGRTPPAVCRHGRTQIPKMVMAASCLA